MESIVKLQEIDNSTKGDIDINPKDFLQHYLTNILKECNNVFFEKNKEILEKNYIVDSESISSFIEFQYFINKTNNIDRGELCSSNLKKFINKIIKPKAIETLEPTKKSNSKHTIFTDFFNEFSAIIEKNLKNTAQEDLFNKFIKSININSGFINISLKNKKDISFFETTQEKESTIKTNTFEFKPIGILESCFPEKFSVPRQGNLLKLTRARIVFNSNIDLSCLEGIEYFDYFWIIYVFHLHQDFTKTKISPPKFKGKKLGIYSTRSPHRLNPIGLTLAKIEKLEKNVLFLSGVDMVDGTPILDIKPYHHLESIPLTNEVKYPEWIRDNSEKPILTKVIFTQEADQDILKILETKKLKFYDKFEDVKEIVKGVLEINPHSKYDNAKKEKLLYAFYIDLMNVIYEYDSENKEIIVLKVEFVTEYKKLRTKEWLKENQEKFLKK